MVVVVEDPSRPETIFEWRGPSYQLGFAVLVASTMASLLEMVSSRLPGLANQVLSLRYLIGATAVGVAALQRSSTWHLSMEDMVYLCTDEHVQAWVPFPDESFRK